MLPQTHLTKADLSTQKERRTGGSATVAESQEETEKEHHKREQLRSRKETNDYTVYKHYAQN